MQKDGFAALPSLALILWMITPVRNSLTKQQVYLQPRMNKSSPCLDRQIQQQLIFYLLTRHSWSYLNFTGQCSRMHVQKVCHHLSYIFRLYFPGIGIRGNMIIKPGGNRSGPDRYHGRDRPPGPGGNGQNAHGA